MTSVEFSKDKELEHLRTRLSSDIDKELSIEELLDLILKFGISNYENLLYHSKIMLNDISISKEQIKLAESFIVHDVQLSDISSTIDNSLYG